MAKVIDDDKRDWDEKIDTILMGYRASKQASIKQSPYYMLFQRQMRLPIDVEVLPPSESESAEDNLDEVVDALLVSREKAFRKAQENISKAQKQQKETYDRKHLKEELQVGTEVLENTAQQQRKGGKMEPVRMGPYTISRCIGKGLYELKNSHGDVLKKKANINRLTLFKRREPKSSLQKPDQEPTKKPESTSQEPRNKPTTPEKPKPTIKKPQSTSMETMSKKLLPPRSIVTRKRHLTDNIGNEAKKRVIVVNSDTESDEDGETTSSDQPWVEIGDIILTNDHREDLLGGKWLNDYHIHAAQQLIKLEPELQHIGGLQRPILGQKLAFDVVPDEMVQILHSGGNHWITVSTIGVSTPATVRVYDSLNTPLPAHTKKQIASIMHVEGKEMILEYANVQVSLLVQQHCRYE